MILAQIGDEDVEEDMAGVEAEVEACLLKK